MIISWIKPDGTKFMAFIPDTFENNLIESMKRLNARPLNEDELKIHNPKQEEKISIKNNVTEQKVNQPIIKKKWWHR